MRNVRDTASTQPTSVKAAIPEAKQEAKEAQGHGWPRFGTFSTSFFSQASASHSTSHQISFALSGSHLSCELNYGSMDLPIAGHEVPPCPR
jgi:hypothetical protein